MLEEYNFRMFHHLSLSLSGVIYVIILKYWREYYLAKHKRKHFSTINIGDFDKIILLYALKFAAQSYFGVCVCCLSGVVDMEVKVPL